MNVWAVTSLWVKVPLSVMSPSMSAFDMGAVISKPAVDSTSGIISHVAEHTRTQLSFAKPLLDIWWSMHTVSPLKREKACPNSPMRATSAQSTAIYKS